MKNIFGYVSWGAVLSGAALFWVSALQALLQFEFMQHALGVFGVIVLMFLCFYGMGRLFGELD